MPPNLTVCRRYCQATATGTAWPWHKNRHTDQGDRSESLGMNLNLHGQSICDKGAGALSGEWHCLQWRGGKTGQNMRKHEAEPPSYIGYKNTLRVDCTLKCKTWSHKNPGRKHQSEQQFFGLVSLVKDHKSKSEQMELLQTKKLLHSEENYQLLNGRQYLPSINLTRG